MKRLTNLILLTFLIGNLISQEVLSPLIVNSNITKSSKKVGNIHNTYVYLFDTLSLPFIDDFSNNHFPSFDALPSDPNVDDSTFWRIEIFGNPAPMGTKLMDDTTFIYEYDTVPGYGFDSIILISKTPNPSQIAGIYDIDVYPYTYLTDEVWPAFNVHDSLWNMTSIGEQFDIDSLDAYVFQDSSVVYFVNETPADSEVFWENKYAYHNYTYAENIQTLGVVTMDGLNDNGYPYDFSSASSYGVADLLTSKPIDLSGVSEADSVYFSFLVEPGGLGEGPESGDSLILEFWSPLVADWITVWSKDGYTSSVFEMELIKITSPIYFQDGFQFRFKNYGSLAGSLDIWHIDFVHLDQLRSYDEFETEDWAYANPSPSFINNYSAMPWSHYEFAPESNMISNISAVTYNSANVPALINPCQLNLYFDGNNINSINYISPGNVPASDYFNMNYTIPTNFWFDTILADTCAEFEVIQYMDNNTLAATELLDNDTLRHTQHFSNYYSYDDGTAEAAYGLANNGAQLAYQFNLEPGLSDSIRAISMHFSPNTNNASNSLFFLQIWDDDGGEPGNLIYTTDQLIPTTYTPEYNLGNNVFFEYVLPEPVLVSGTYYVGWKQSTADRLNIGFDKNLNNQDRIFYNLSSSWANTGFEGSLMMRPVFISDKDFILSQKETLWDPEINIYPNPTNNEIYISSESNDLVEAQLYDLHGKLVKTTQLNDSIVRVDLSSHNTGLYILNIIGENGASIQRKISIVK